MLCSCWLIDSVFIQLMFPVTVEYILLVYNYHLPLVISTGNTAKASIPSYVFLVHFDPDLLYKSCILFYLKTV